MSVGRNDPCPCGSGRKYKKCHGALEAAAVASPEAVRANVLKARDVALGDRLMRFARMRHGSHWLHDTIEAHDLLDEGGSVPDVELPLVIPWLQHFRVDESGSTLAGEWLEQQRRVSADDRLLLDAYDSAWLSLWEVAAVEPGTGSRLFDVLTREERFVHDVSSTATLRRFDTILAVVLTCDGVSFFGGIHSQRLPPRFVGDVTRAARRLCRVRTRPVTPEKLRDPAMQLILLELWRDAVDDMRHQPPPVLHNTDGDPLAPTRDDFALLAPAAEVSRRLASLPGVEEPELEDGEEVFTVVKAGNAVHRSWDNTVIGRLILSPGRLTVETNSTRRADALRSTVETGLPGLVRFRLRREDNLDELLKTARATDAARKRPGERRGERRRERRREEDIPPEALAALRQFREQHMHDWLDNAIPALDGLTPREAAARPRMRPKLETLLKEFEQSEARLPEDERIELGWVWGALGF